MNKLLLWCNLLAGTCFANMTWAQPNAILADLDYQGQPLTTNVSKPYRITAGLAGRHLSVWASHGLYYEAKRNSWQWQRPPLFGTNEDLFTPTIVLPYLIPMLEKSGAIVLSPRERDLQTEEVIVDNDAKNNHQYKERNGLHHWRNTSSSGFANPRATYVDGENPFTMGTARMARTVKQEDKRSEIAFIPQIKNKGKKAVYVCYQTLPESTDNAQYTVYHKGQATTFSVNQRMGGGTWVYLGTFDFGEGYSKNNCVVLNNVCSKDGVVTADAVRFGGGMGNIRRGESVSGMPRALEGARYAAQWYGAPQEVYSSKEGRDDYGDDVNARALISNWWAGGSVFLPTKQGLGIPIELCLGIHSDAGADRRSKNIVGSLAICTSYFNDGRLATGVTRNLSVSFAESLLETIHHDLNRKFGRWEVRELIDKNYSETRMPEIPSAILETLSHQNFPDMRLGHDPNFKFALARAVYKSILRFMCNQHGTTAIVTPLAPSYFHINYLYNGQIKLGWRETNDELEPTAKPTGYILYTAVDSAGFDNGRLVKQNEIELSLHPHSTYHFKVAAVNEGGESFTTETLSAYYQPEATNTILVVDGFDRLSSPAVIDTQQLQGFDLNEDLGVSLGTQAAWIGHQQNFNKWAAGVDGWQGLGYSDTSMQGQLVAGNNQNTVQTHVEDIAATRKYNVVSTSMKAVEKGLCNLSRYQCIDIALGLQRNDGHSLVNYKTFTPIAQKLIREYAHKNGRLIVSGAYVGTDMRDSLEQVFLSDVFKASFDGAVKSDTLLAAIRPLANDTDSVARDSVVALLYKSPNAVHYAPTKVDVLTPLDGATTGYRYTGWWSASVAYVAGNRRSHIFGFPLECIKDSEDRRRIMAEAIDMMMK
jgi:fibronectin type III domain protein